MAYTIDAKSSDLLFDIPPLSFDRVHGGHVTTSLFPLFQMPVELFSHFLNHLSTNDLLAFSQVDRDCRRLAMLSIFKDVRLCFAPDMSHKFQENIPSSTTADLGHCLHSPSSYIASCVRRLIVTADSFNRATPHYATAFSEYDDLSLAKIDLSLSNFVESASYIQKWYPNIHVLDWDAPTLVSATTLDSILASPVKHLRFKGATIHGDGSTSHSTGGLSLETLSFEVSFTQSKHCRPPHVFKDILLRTSATLRQLIWTGYLNDDEVDINSDISSFPCLRSVTLDIISSDSAKVMQLLLGPSTRVETLAVDVMAPSTHHFFAARGYVSSLKQLCLLNRSESDLSPYEMVLGFLQDNTQLEALHIPCPAPSQFLLLLLPTLSQHFKALNSLHLVWISPDICEDGLEAISGITTLRHLWLSAGNQNSLRSTWEVDHQSILAWLSPLRHLETFALSHDTYKVNAHPLAPRSFDYYASRALPVALEISKYLSATEFDVYQGKYGNLSLGYTQQIEMHRLAWESWHAERMLEITNEYVVPFPSLRWLFIGQLLFTRSFSEPFSLARKPTRRDPYLASLQKKMSMTLWRPI